MSDLGLPANRTPVCTSSRDHVSHLRPHELEFAERARAARHFRAGFDEGGGAPASVYLIGALADAVLELADSLDASRSGAQALQARCDSQQALLGQRAWDALRGAGS